MKYGAFVLDQVKEVGKEQALQLSLPFEELAMLSENKHFLFENMPTIKTTNVLMSTDETTVEGPQAQ